MIQVIAGKKGSGKTKRLIDMTNAKARESIKDVVFLDDDSSYMYEVDHKARFVNAGDYHVHTPDMFVGFLSGMLSQNFDIGTVFIDAFCKLCKVELKDAEPVFKLMEELCQKHNVDFVLSVSAEVADLPAFMTKYLI